MKIKPVLIFFILSLIFWALLNNTWNTTTMLIGAVFSFILAWLFHPHYKELADLKITPYALLYTILYIFVFLYELIKSNLDVARRVITPSLPINPGIVEVKTRLQSKIGRMILANSITLTPGTLTIDMIDDTLYIHWIDVKTEDMEAATKKIVGKFEKYLEKIYG